MANSPQAIKRARQANKRNAHNTDIRSKARTQIKKTRVAIASNDDAASKAEFTQLQKKLDQTVSKGLLPKKRAARLKSRINKLAKAAAGK